LHKKSSKNEKEKEKDLKERIMSLISFDIISIISNKQQIGFNEYLEGIRSINDFFRRIKCLCNSWALHQEKEYQVELKSNEYDDHYEMSHIQNDSLY
jgi:hypothetical protein